jgi:Sulfotransferase family
VQKNYRTRPVNQPKGFPDFFVIGAPRCGTTSLCRFFAKNPQICFSRPKEPHYFVRIGSLPSPADLTRGYLERYFGHRQPGHRIAGEGSVSYFYAPEAIERIRHFNPEARFVVMLRNPMSMLPSYHLKMRFLLQEDEADFASAWRLQEARGRGGQVPRHCLDPRTLMYGEVVKFGAHIERVFDIAGRERTHVIVFDDFVANPLGVYRGVLGFLGVEYDGRTGFAPRNESRIYRHRWLQELLYVPASRGDVTKDVARRVALKHKHSKSRMGGWVQRLAEWNRLSVTPSPLTPEMRAVVAAHLRSDNELLGRLLRRDLSFWLANPAVPPAPLVGALAQVRETA